MYYTLPFVGVPVGVSGVGKTIASLTVPDVAGNRFRIRALAASGSNTPEDIQIEYAIKRILDLSVGSAGVGTAVVPSKRDTSSEASIITAKTNYTAGNEPSAYAVVDVWSTGANHRGSINKEWDEDDAPVFTRDQLAGLVAVTSGASSAKLVGSIGFEQF